MAYVVLATHRPRHFEAKNTNSSSGNVLFSNLLNKILEVENVEMLAAADWQCLQTDKTNLYKTKMLRKCSPQ